MVEKARHWYTEVPCKCQLCKTPIVDVFYDARTEDVRWAFVCEACFEGHRLRLGAGLGQRYELQDKAQPMERLQWLKTAG